MSCTQPRLCWMLLAMFVVVHSCGAATAEDTDSITFETTVVIEGQGGRSSQPGHACDEAETDAWDKFFDYYQTLETMYGAGNVSIRFIDIREHDVWHFGPLAKVGLRGASFEWVDADDRIYFGWYAKWKLRFAIQVSTPPGAPTPSNPPNPPSPRELPPREYVPGEPYVPGTNSDEEDLPLIIIPGPSYDDDPVLIPVYPQPEVHDVEPEVEEDNGFFDGFLDGLWDGDVMESPPWF